MKKTDAVFQLIKSLTRGEKRNFRMLAQLTSGDKKYLQLFDVMDGLDDYDEEKILKKFRKDPAFEKQFAYNKNYLYNNILNALAYFHKGMDAELSSLTLQVRILLEKNLYYQAKKMIRKVKEKLQLQEKFEELLRVLQFEIEILKRTENLKLLRESLRQVEIEEQITLQKIDNLLKYKRLESKVFMLMKVVYYSRTDEENKLYNEVDKAKEMESESEAQSIKAKVLYNIIHMKKSTYDRNQGGALAFCERAIELMESNRNILESDPEKYMLLLSNAARYQFLTKGFETAIETLLKVKSIKIRTPHHRTVRFKLYYTIFLAMHNDVGKPVSPEFLQELFKEARSLNNDLATSYKLWAYYQISNFFLIHGDFSESLKWMNDFLNYPRNTIRTDLQAMARLVNLIIHFELGNFDLIEYKLKSTYRFIYKQEILHNYERRVLSFFRKAINLTDKEELHAELQSFRDDLDEVFKDPKERIVLNYFHMYAWIDSKLKGTSYAESLREYNSKGIGVYQEKVSK